MIEYATTITHNNHQKCSDAATLKIMVVSTPKTGNTWVKHLLSAIYALPFEDLDETFSAKEVQRFGPRWIAHEHYAPHSQLLNWADENAAIFVTTVRHPADMFLSLYHYTMSFGQNPHHDSALVAAISRDGNKIGPHVAGYIEDRFFCYLNTSISWLRCGKSCAIRYEDLWRDPLAALTNLTSQILPVEQDRIERAIDRCDINALRKKSGQDSRFFRQGQVGEWRQKLPPEIIEIFRRVEPYPAQFAALGYTLDPKDPVIDAPATLRSRRQPVHDLTQFDNGIVFQPLFADLYLSVDSEVTAKWPSPASTEGRDTFFHWMNVSSDQDPLKHTDIPLVTNLATHIYFSRRDIRALFPDLYGKNRMGYILWFLQNAKIEHRLDDVFIVPLYKSFMRWAVLPSADDPYKHRIPTITNLAAYLYSVRPDLQAQWPDLYGEHRVDYAVWFVQFSRWEYGFEKACILPVVLSWATLERTDDRQ